MALRNGLLNGNSHTFPHDPSASNARFSDIPPAIDIQVAGADTDEAVELSLEELPDDSTELCTLLESERAPKNTWMVIALAYAKQDRIDHAVEILNRALQSGPLSKGNPKEKLGLLSCVCWLHLLKSREAPRVVPEGQLVSEAKTKDAFLQLSTGVLNEASRIHPSFSPLFLTRGVLYLLRASLFPPSKAVGPGNVENSERMETLRNALKSFDDASRASNGRNIMAVFGRARTQYCLGQYDLALKGYQEVLVKMPGLTDPDPRLGIGCCLWQLNFKEEAKAAWMRALELVSPSIGHSH
jgi:RNA polymerase-associated protein CTR9